MRVAYLMSFKDTIQQNCLQWARFEIRLEEAPAQDERRVGFGERAGSVREPVKRLDGWGEEPAFA